MSNKLPALSFLDMLEVRHDVNDVRNNGKSLIVPLHEKNLGETNWCTFQAFAPHSPLSLQLSLDLNSSLDNIAYVITVEPETLFN